MWISIVEKAQASRRRLGGIPFSLFFTAVLSAEEFNLLGLGSTSWEWGNYSTEDTHEFLPTHPPW